MENSEDSHLVVTYLRRDEDGVCDWSSVKSACSFAGVFFFRASGAKLKASLAATGINGNGCTKEFLPGGDGSLSSQKWRSSGGM